jgi:hypothetical protein
MVPDEPRDHLPDSVRPSSRSTLWAGLGVLSALLSAGVLLMKCALAAGPSYSPSIDLASVAPLDRPADLGLAEGGPPIEFALEHDGTSTDVGGAPIALADGTSIALRRRESLSWSGAGVSFDHPQSVHVTLQGEGTDAVEIVASGPGGTLVRLSPFAGESDANALRDQIAEGLGMQMGLVRSPSAPVRTIAGAASTGVLLASAPADMSVETHAVMLAPDLVLAATLFFSSTADVIPLEQVIASVRAGERPPAPEFDLDAGGATHALVVDEPLELGASTIVLRRRPTIRRTYAGIEFEHDRRFVASEVPNPIMSRLQLNNGTVGVTITTTYGMGADELVGLLAPSIHATDSTPVTRDIAGAPRQGRHARLTMGATTLENEMFAFERNGRTIGLFLQYAEADRALAETSFAQITSSIR